MVIYLPNPPDSDLFLQFERLLGPNFRLTFGTNDFADAEVVVQGDLRPLLEDIPQMPKLQSIVIPYAGVPGWFCEAMAAHPNIGIFNIHHNQAPTCETAIGLMFACAKRTVILDRLMRDSDWSPRYTTPGNVLLEGKRVLIIGYGSIGRRIGAVCTALGMHVDAIKRTVRQAYDGEVSLYAPAGLEHVISKADFVILSCPATPETEGLVNADLIAKMKPGAFVINVARGSVIEEEAFFVALRDGRLGGAGLDVWWEYPKGKDETTCPPSKFDFASLENVVMSPHVGGATKDSERLRWTHVAELLKRLEEGKAGPFKVDLSLGY